MNITKPNTSATSATWGKAFNPAAFVAASVCSLVVVASVMVAFDDVSPKSNELLVASAGVATTTSNAANARS
jgi:hypothetical protein